MEHESPVSFLRGVTTVTAVARTAIASDAPSNREVLKTLPIAGHVLFRVLADDLWAGNGESRTDKPKDVQSTTLSSVQG
eukprot:gene9517-biopygen7367